MGGMGSSDFAGYCSFTKAIEHLGDSWSLLILRELGMFGSQGFNELALQPAGR
jgi:DNA-binding HxlR family transcriptional regulator